MDITTVIGILTGIFLIVNGISANKLGNFLDISSLLIVVGGTAAAVAASYPPHILLDIPRHMKVLFRGKKYDIPRLVEELVEFAAIARESGLLAMEEKALGLEDPFFRRSVLMVVDGYEPDKVRSVLERERNYLAIRHDEAAGLYEKASSYAPAFGMIGTLVGLINMLKGLNIRQSTGQMGLGEDMSVALITTFYGSVLSNVVFHPIAKKLRIRQDEEDLYCSTIIEGVIAIRSGENPQFLREHLLAMIKQSQVDNLNAHMKEKREKWL